MSRTRWLLFSPRRQPGRGAAGSGQASFESFRCLGRQRRLGGASRDSRRQREHRAGPKECRTWAQGVREICCSRVTRGSDPAREFGTRGLREAAGEAVQAAGEPWVVFAGGGPCAAMSFLEKSSVKRKPPPRCDRGDKVHVGLNGVTRGGRMPSPVSACSRGRPVASTRRSHFHPTGPCAIANVIEDAFAPWRRKADLLAREAASLMGMRL
jgi:hypothetical protein